MPHFSFLCRQKSHEICGCRARRVGPVAVYEAGESLRFIFFGGGGMREGSSGGPRRLGHPRAHYVIWQVGGFSHDSIPLAGQVP